LGCPGEAADRNFKKIIKRGTASKTTNIVANPWDWEKYSAASTCDGPSRDNGASPPTQPEQLDKSVWTLHKLTLAIKRMKNRKAADDCGLVATTLAPCFICFLAHADE